MLGNYYGWHICPMPRLSHILCIAGMQVNMFAPQTGNPSFGVVRVLAKDSNDAGRNNNSLSFIDSDGQVKTQCIKEQTAPPVATHSLACHDNSGRLGLGTCATPLSRGA